MTNSIQQNQCDLSKISDHGENFTMKYRKKQNTTIK